MSRTHFRVNPHSIMKLECVFQTNLEFPAIFVTEKETFIHPSNVQDQIENKEGTYLK